MTLLPPLRKMILIQPFGVNYGPTPDFYTKIGLKAHNGWDLSASGGTEVFAVMDGELAYTEGGEGYGNDIHIRNRELGLEVVYGHLKKRIAVDGPVKAGDLIALSNNTGYSTGDHLHLGVRPIIWHIDGSGPYVIDSLSGYFGYVDPSLYFPPDIFDLPVDKRYGFTPRTPGVPSEFSFFSSKVYFYRTQKRLMTTRESNALRFGFHDLRTVLDPAMFPVWSTMTKMEAQKQGLIK